jgi:hypothetical protein
MKRVRVILLPALALALLVGCKAFDGYVRSYTLSAEDRFGQKVSIGITLDPKQDEAVPVVIDRLEHEGVIAKGATVKEEPVSMPLEPAAEKLAILTEPAEPSSPIFAPPSPSDAMVWLTRNGALRLATSPQAIAMLRNSGWVDAPLPLYDPEKDFAPQWRNGKWVVRKTKGARHD